MTELTEEKIKMLVKEAIKEVEAEKRKDNTYTVNQVRKRLGISHETLTKRIKAGLLKTTADGRLSEASINEYLKNTP